MVLAQAAARSLGKGRQTVAGFTGAAGSRSKHVGPGGRLSMSSKRMIKDVIKYMDRWKVDGNQEVRIRQVA